MGDRNSEFTFVLPPCRLLLRPLSAYDDGGKGDNDSSIMRGYVDVLWWEFLLGHSTGYS